MESHKINLLDQELELMQTRIMLNKLVALNLSLYNAILNYAKRKGIPLTLDSNILRLVEEIEKTDTVRTPKPFKLSDDWKHRDDSDGDVTEPNSRLIPFLESFSKRRAEIGESLKWSVNVSIISSNSLLRHSLLSHN
jgi:hypothetical protein